MIKMIWKHYSTFTTVNLPNLIILFYPSFLYHVHKIVRAFLSFLAKIKLFSICHIFLPRNPFPKGCWVILARSGVLPREPTLVLKYLRIVKKKNSKILCQKSQINSLFCSLQNVPLSAFLKKKKMLDFLYVPQCSGSSSAFPWYITLDVFCSPDSGALWLQSASPLVSSP